MAGLRLTLLLRACGWRGVAEREEVMIFFFQIHSFQSTVRCVFRCSRMLAENWPYDIFLLGAISKGSHSASTPVFGSKLTAIRFKPFL